MNTRDRVGLGWRDPLAASIYTHLDAVDVLELIADDYFFAAAPKLRSMRALGRDVPLVLHGVALGLASVTPIARKRLDRLAKVVNALEPDQWSEHLAFVRGGSYEIGHLAAPPRNFATVEGASNNIARVRAVVGADPALENVATLVDPPDSALAEPEWVSAVLAASASPALLDLHNLYANAVNFGHDPSEYLLRFPLDRVRMIHISGGHWIRLDASDYGLTARRLLDDHVHDVPEAVFAMLTVLGQCCPQPLTVILERDGRYPEFARLLEQVGRAREALAQGRRAQFARTKMQQAEPPRSEAYELAAI